MNCVITAVKVKGKVDQEIGNTESTEVTERAGQATTYRFKYEVDISKGDLPLLVDQRFDPGSELSVLVPVKNSIHCLVKGPVHGQQIHLAHGGAGSWLEVRGSDTSVVMDRETRSKVWSNVKDSDVVQAILSNYGYVPDVQATPAGHYEKKHTLIQRESDLGFIRRLARRNGCHFWISCNELGVETAHFKRPRLEAQPVAELVINLAKNSLNTLGIEWDVEQPTSIAGRQLDLNGKTNLDVTVAQTPQPILGDQGLQAITGDTRSVHLSAPADDAGDLQARGEAALIEADWFIRANCQTTLEELGVLVRPHNVVEIKGAGSRHSGKYYVTAVHHVITSVAHRMEMELIRNGWN